MAQNEENCEPCKFSTDEQYVFVQYYVILEEDVVAKDAVDQKLNCISLKWERHGEDDEQREKGKVYELCPLDSFRGQVHVVQLGPLLQLLHDSVPYKKNFRDGLKHNVDWQSEVFYANRFLHNDHMPIKKNSNN